jgi:hypothetical protein
MVPVGRVIGIVSVICHVLVASGCCSFTLTWQKLDLLGGLWWFCMDVKWAPMGIFFPPQEFWFLYSKMLVQNSETKERVLFLGVVIL